jgi:signal transduction histidine kinase
VISSAKARQLELEAAEHRVAEHLKTSAVAPSSRRRITILSVSAVLFAGVFAARLAVNDPSALLANFYLVPIALVAIEFGAVAGLLAGIAAMGLVFAWAAVRSVHLGVLGYVARGAALLIVGALVGRFAEKLRQDVAERRRAERQLSLYADQLERANHHLARSVERLEAIGEIARALGDETDLERVLSLILAHAAEMVDARSVVMYLLDGQQLVAARTRAVPGEHARRVPVTGSLLGRVIQTRQPLTTHGDGSRTELSELWSGARTAVLLPLVFRGEALGVLVAMNGVEGREFEAEDEELLMSVAANAATAVATVRSVAATRLRLSLEAADQARARWARELHDETLQGLTGARMLLSAGLARNGKDTLQNAAEAADAQLGEEVRKLRELIAELRPAALDDLGLGPAIESLAKRQAAVGSFSVDVKILLIGPGRLAHETENAIYRIVQEALNNAVKHAHASSVTLRVEERAGRLEISVRDDGSGFDPSRVCSGFGLTGMRERAVLEGGQLSVSSSEGGPTCVTAVLPLPSGNGARRHVASG